jgi:hypothetical protein
MRFFARDLLAAWLVLLLVTTSFALATQTGRVAGKPLWALCGGSGAAIPAPDAPDSGPHPCLDCLAPALSAAPPPALDRQGPALWVIALPAGRPDVAGASGAWGPGIRAPPVRL